MTLIQVIHDLAWLGALVGVVLLLLGLAGLLGVLRKSDDGFRPVSEPAPPPPRTSPFVSPSPCSDGETGRSCTAGEVKP
jgi:hypothetical protein